MIEFMENHQLAQFSFFQGLSELEIERLKNMLELCSLPAGMVLFEQDTEARFLYILLDGEVGIEYKPYDGPAAIIAKILPGNVFGWSAALNRKKYSTSARTLKICSAYRIETTSLTQLCERCPNTARVFLERLAGVIAEHIESSPQELVAFLKAGLKLQDEC